MIFSYLAFIRGLKEIKKEILSISQNVECDDI